MTEVDSGLEMQSGMQHPRSSLGCARTDTGVTSPLQHNVKTLAYSKM